jgi:hypothetical protein
MKEKCFDEFLSVFLSATEKITDKYFQVTVADKDNGKAIIYRERAYCYELYSKARQLLPEDFPFTFQGEIDKKGHPIIVEKCGAINPDFVLHIPGNMGEDDNLVIIEVKTIQGVNFGEKGGFLKDIKTINCMTNIENGYYKGIILIFGAGEEEKKKVIEEVYRKSCDTNKVLLLFQDNYETKARVL